MQNTIVKTYSFGDYAEHVAAIPPSLRIVAQSNWAGASWEDALYMLRNGDMSNVAQIEAIIDQMQDQEIFTIGLPQPVRSYYGAVPNIGAAIAGHPKAMYRRKCSDNPSINSPISLYVDVGVSAGVSHKELMQRGIAIMAFVLAMCKIRPTTLYFIDAGQPTSRTNTVCHAIKMDTTPIDLGRAAFALTHPAFLRRIGFSSIYNDLGALHNNEMLWAWGLAPTDSEYINNMRQVFTMEPQDIFITGGHLTDRIMKTDPIAWVKQMLAKHGAAAE